jgi:hypothetical protein
MKTDKCLIVLVLMTVASALLAGCGSAQPTTTVIPATEPPIPTDTPLPSPATPAPAATMIPPTETPILADTPALSTNTSTAPVWPTKRHWHTMAYDPQSGRVLLFCGYSRRVLGYYPWTAQGLEGDEWAYDMALNLLEPLGAAPNPIYNVAAYDEQSGRVIGFGPEDTAVYNVESNAWERMNPAVQPPTFRFGFTLAYDVQSDRVILFGGGVLLHDWMNDTWAYDYESNTWAEMSPEVSPPRRDFHAMAYDAESDLIILWGANEIGRTPMTQEEKATVWAYDYETDTWTAIASTGSPSYRGGHTMVYHPGTDRIILFGGYHQGDVSFSDETWSYDYNTNTWTQLQPTTHPSGRRHHAMVYDHAADKMVLFGGIAGNWLNEEIGDELWIFDPVLDEWSQVTPDSLSP